MTKEEAMTLALEALQWFTAAEPWDEPDVSKAIKALEEALASEQKQRSVSEHLGEPVAQYRDLHSHMMVVSHRAADKVTNNGQKFASQKEFVRAICIAIQSDQSLISKLTTPRPAQKQEQLGEPVAYIHRNEYNEYRLEPHDNFDIKSIPFNVDVPLFKGSQPAPQRPKAVFPTMLRKMWSGGEVQAWLDENVNKEKNT